jgi:hypothetical protein
MASGASTHGVLRRRLALPVGFVALLVILGFSLAYQAPGGGGGNGPAPSIVVDAVVPHCPRVLDEALFAPGIVSARPPLIPAGPTAAAACRYSGYDQPGVAPGTLEQSAALSGAAAQRLAVALNAGRPGTDAGWFCPFDARARDLVVFTYPHGPAVRIGINPYGCTLARRLDQVPSPTVQLSASGRRQLQTLVGMPPTVPNG